MPKFSDVNHIDSVDAHVLLAKSVDGLHSLTMAQGLFSFAMFNTPDVRSPAAVLDHVRKEVEEVAIDPMNLQEWADLVILALDGLQRACWLHNHRIPKGSTVSGQAPADVIRDKMQRNFDREWPALAEQDPTRAVEHVRSEAEQAAKNAEAVTAPVSPIPPKPNNRALPDIKKWGEEIREYAKLMGYPDVQLMLISAGLAYPSVPAAAPTYMQCLDVVAATHKVSTGVVQEYMVEAMRNSLPAYRADMAQRIAVESVIRKAGYNDLLTFVLTALADMGHVVPEATDEGGEG